MAKLIDLRKIKVVDASLIFDNLENEINGNIEFVASEAFLKGIDVFPVFDLIYRISHNKNEKIIEEIECRSCFAFSHGWHRDEGDISGIVTWRIEFMTPDANVNVLHLFKSKEGKEIAVTQDIAELVNKFCNPKDITFDNLQKIILACKI